MHMFKSIRAGAWREEVEDRASCVSPTLVAHVCAPWLGELPAGGTRILKDDRRRPRVGGPMTDLECGYKYSTGMITMKALRGCQLNPHGKDQAHHATGASSHHACTDRPDHPITGHTTPSHHRRQQQQPTRTNNPMRLPRNPGQPLHTKHDSLLRLRPRPHHLYRETRTQ